MKEIVANCMINTHTQSQKNKDFESDLKKMTSSFNDFSSKYGDKIAGFYLFKMKNSDWMINVATDGEVK